MFPKYRTPALALATAGAALTLALMNPLAASAAESAQYRVSATGFSVTSQTWDDASQSDGKCDEVFLSAQVEVLQKSTGAAYFRNPPDSATFGDRNGYPNRTLAGSCTGWFQPAGGLRDGDRVYTNYELFNGVLTRGDDAAVITPVINEWDTGGSAVMDWARWAQGTLEQQRPLLDTLLGSNSYWLDWTQFGLNVITSATDVFGTPGTRPIGMVKENGAIVFKPQSLGLTYDVAELIIRNGGTLSMVFADDPGLRGRYSLNLKVERLTAPAPAPTPVPTDPIEPDEPVENPLCLKKPWLCDV
jgi:hypothetical protein